MKLSMPSVLGWVSRRAKHRRSVHPCMFEVMDSSGSGTVPFTTHALSLGMQVVESESVLCQEDARVALVENVYYYLAEKR